MKTVCQSVLLFLALTGAASAQRPVLNSFPSASNVIFLDFDGQLVQGTSWNGSGPLVCDSATMNAAQITAVFNRVAEDFRPFTLNVTTDSTRYWAAPANRRMRVIMTPTWQWYGQAGGVAFLNSFTWGDNTPCFVFTSLHNNNVKNVAEAASHEAGHTLGLRHQSAYDAQCNKLSEYNAGTGSGEIGWAPIMGNGYYRNMTLWNFGSNPFACNAYQDDLSVIVSNDNGVAFRTDDHANTPAAATPVAFTNNSFALAGIIEQPGDADAVRFTAPANGRLQLSATPYSIAAGNAGANLDVQLELLNGAENVVGVYNGETVLNAGIDTALNAGTYYLRVQGKGNAFAPNYAVLGAYNITANFISGNALPVRKLQLKGAADGRRHKLDWEIVADEKVLSQTVEAAWGGSGYQAVANPDAGARSHGADPAANGLVYYRLNVLFDNGRRYYSNVVALKNADKAAKPSLVGNLTHGTLTVNSPASGPYRILDAAGRLVAQGTLTQGVNLLAPRFAGNGIYLIVFGEGAEQTAEKFSKQ